MLLVDAVWSLEVQESARSEPFKPACCLSPPALLRRTEEPDVCAEAGARPWDLLSAVGGCRPL